MNEISLLSNEDVSTFQRDGFVLGGRLLSDEVAGELANVIDEIILDKTHALHKRVHDFRHGDRPLLHIRDMWRHFDSFKRLYANGAIKKAFLQLSGGTEYQLWQDRFFFKPARSGSFHSWHQDDVYVPFTKPFEMITAWIALTDADSENGTMCMVPGSHLWGEASEEIDTFPEVTGDGSGLPDTYNGHSVTVRQCAIKKGHVHFHHGSTWHGSLPNWSQRSRCGIALHCVNEGTIFDGSHRFASNYAGTDKQNLDPSVYPLLG